MSYTDDVVKIRYTREGYLPDYPFHLVSDDEMCDAFIRLPESVQASLTPDFFGPTVDTTSDSFDWFSEYMNSTDIMYFKDHYPEIDESLEKPYKALVNRIFYEIQEFKNNLYDNRSLPDWVYSYMLGVAIGPASDKLDIHSMISSKMMNVDNLYDEYNVVCALVCLDISEDWLRRLILPKGEVQRPPTMFGEPHVLKAIRLFDESLVVEHMIQT